MIGFEVVIGLDFLLATVLMSVDFLRRETKLRQPFLLILMVGFAVATIDLVLHALRAAETGTLPFSGSSQVFNTFAWSLVAIVLYNHAKARWFSVSVLLTPLAFFAALLALFQHENLHPVRSQLATALFAVHIGVLLFGIACFCLAFFAGLFYLVAQKELKSKHFGRFLTMLPPLEVLDRTAVRWLLVGVLLLTVGNATGIYLAHVFWKTAWLTQNKFIFSMLTWGWFLLLLAVRRFAGWRGGRFFVLLVIGFVFLLFTFGLSVIWDRPWT